MVYSTRDYCFHIPMCVFKIEPETSIATSGAYCTPIRAHGGVYLAPGNPCTPCASGVRRVPAAAPRSVADFREKVITDWRSAGATMLPWPQETAEVRVSQRVEKNKKFRFLLSPSPRPSAIRSSREGDVSRRSSVWGAFCRYFRVHTPPQFTVRNHTLAARRVHTLYLWNSPESITFGRCDPLNCMYENTSYLSLLVRCFVPDVLVLFMYTNARTVYACEAVRRLWVEPLKIHLKYRIFYTRIIGVRVPIMVSK